MAQRFLIWCGFVLLLIWLLWWGVSLQQGGLLWANKTSIHVPAFGIDFWANTESHVRVWLSGGNPYSDKEFLFAYPPIVSRLFAWVYFFSSRQALVIWVSVLGLVAAWSGYVVLGWREKIGLKMLPKVFLVALFLFSTPVLFAIERGNYDLLIIPFLIGGVFLSEKEVREAQIFGGALIAIAIWLKLYPALLVVGLFFARRFSAVFWTILWVGLIAVFDVAELMQFLVNTKIHVAREKAIASLGAFVPLPWNHSLTLSWSAIWAQTPLGKVGGGVGGLAVIGGLLAWVGYEFWRTRVPAELLKPYLLWIVAAATFLPPVSNDYNLAPLLLVLVAVWQGQHLFNWVTLAALIVWAQPVGTEIPGIPMMFIKLVGLGGVAWLLVQSIRASVAHNRVDP